MMLLKHETVTLSSNGRLMATYQEEGCVLGAAGGTSGRRSVSRGKSWTAAAGGATPAKHGCHISMYLIIILP